MGPVRLRRPLATTLLVLAALAPMSSLAPAPAEAQVFGYFGKNKITYEEFDWQVYHSTHFDVYYYPEEEALLPKVVSFAETAYDEISRRLDFQITEPTALIVYATHSAFEQNNISFNFVPEGVGAFATPVRFRMVMPADLPDAQLFALIKHELTHIFEYHILFQGSLARAVAVAPPLWVMEGFASYMADDEKSWDLMYLRDAVVNDAIPPISQADFGGFLAYRFGHAVFDFMEERWGEDGIQDFIYELRNTISLRADRAIERAFRIEPDDFDADFRRWLRQRFLPELVATGEPLDFGRPFRVENRPSTWDSSGVVSPSGDLVAAFSTPEGEVDVVLFDARKRRLHRNLTKGFSNQYQFLIGQLLSVGRSMGRDLAFSPDGDLVAVFGKREGGRSLLLLDVLRGGVARRIDLDNLGLEQQLAPAFSPDGRSVAFAAWRAGRFDVFAYDLETDELTNLTDDDLFDGSPVYSPDGGRLVLSSVVDGYQKLFELDLATGSRRQVSFGESHERDATFSPDGRTLYLTSDRTGADNIYSVDLETGRVTQHTNAVTGCFMPSVFIDDDGNEQVVYTGFWRQNLSLYLADPEDALPGPGEGGAGAAGEGDAADGAAGPEGAEADEGAEAGDPAVAGEAEPAAESVPFIVLGGETADPEALPRFEPGIEVPIDMANREDYRGLKLFLQNADTFVAVDSDGTVLGRLILSFSDYIGDHQVIALLESVYTFSNFDVVYLDTSRRWNWAARLYDDRTYFASFNTQTGQFERDRLYAETGLMGYVIYPLSFFRRVEIGAGARYRNIPDDLFFDRELPDGTLERLRIYEAQDEVFPVVEASLVGDSTRFVEYGPIAGRRWRLGASYAPDLEESGTLTTEVSVDLRQYVKVTRRSNFAFRVWGAASDGNFTRPYFFGGLNQLRGVDIYSQVGDHAFYANGEYRFPLIDVMQTPIFNIRNIRGLVFLDVGAAYFDDAEDFDFWDSQENRLADPISSYGLGISAQIFGLPVQWAFSKRWDLKDTLSDFDTSFWIGPSF